MWLFWFPVSLASQNLLDEIASMEQGAQKVYADSQQYQQAVKVSHEPCQSTQEGLLPQESQRSLGGLLGKWVVAMCRPIPLTK